jgi:hypothetical protein
LVSAYVAFGTIRGLFIFVKIGARSPRPHLVDVFGDSLKIPDPNSAGDGGIESGGMLDVRCSAHYPNTTIPQFLLKLLISGLTAVSRIDIITIDMNCTIQHYLGQKLLTIKRDYPAPGQRRGK